MSYAFPKVFFIGATDVDYIALEDYLRYTGQESFLADMNEAQTQGVNPGEILCSFYAKLCYASLTDSKNKNISRVRSIPDNILSILDTGHGSVIEHCSLNFVVTDCSRVFTHELVRHRVGTAFSQTSGRYVRNDELKIIMDPILTPVSDIFERVRLSIQEGYKEMEQKMFEGVTDFSTKKKITSALRRIMPNGQANEIGVTINLRTLRQTIEARTSRHAEWEIRLVYNQIYDLVWSRYPLMFSDAKREMVENQYEITFRNKKI